MVRAFDEHYVRKVTSLSGTWKFKIDPEDIGVTAGWALGLSDAETVTVPSMWNDEKDLLTYEGVAWYEKSFYTEGGCLRFVFEAVMTTGDVYLDGVLLTSHYGGFTAFDCIVDNVSQGIHRLSVRVDNRFDKKSIPQERVDWYHYGGIPRDVSLETLSGVVILSSRLEYELNEAMDTATVTPVVRLYNASTEALDSSLSVALNGTVMVEAHASLGAHKTVESVLPAFTVEGVTLWDTAAPNLYTVAITTDTDDLIDRIGFRRIEVRDGRILLNGKEIELCGVNRHEEYPGFGFAFPRKLMKRDIDIIEDLGCNTLRGSHYPNSKYFLDLLDERGILFWSEIPIWGCGFSEEALADTDVIKCGYVMHREMVEQYYNHPSIVIWGMHNEILSNSESSLPMTRLYYEFLKKTGGNRLVTFASRKPMDDLCFDYCDIICINAYYGWYSETISAWNEFLEKFRSRRSALNMTEKPVVISEFGASALYGHHTFDNIPWTEEYQAELITYCIELFHQDPMIVGCYVWQFTDIRTTRKMGLDRARGFNNKGILNEYRKPKAAYAAIRSLFRRYNKESCDS